MGQTRRNPSSVRSTVQEDWIGWLPVEKCTLYEATSREWEDRHGMFSVVLNEALEMREQGELSRARKSAEFAAELVGRLGEPLLAAYQSLSLHGRQIVVIPAVAPLNPEYFRGETARRNASWNLMLHRVVFGGRSRYLHKLRALELIVSTLVSEFQEVADGLVAGVRTRPLEACAQLELLHYDLTTCLGESQVMLKSFLRCLPDIKLESFRKDLKAVALRVAGRRRALFSSVSF